MPRQRKIQTIGVGAVGAELSGPENRESWSFLDNAPEAEQIHARSIPRFTKRSGPILSCVSSGLDQELRKTSLAHDRSRSRCNAGALFLKVEARFGELHCGEIENGFGRFAVGALREFRRCSIPGTTFWSQSYGTRKSPYVFC
jgi:hypothetical protein